MRCDDDSTFIVHPSSVARSSCLRPTRSARGATSRSSVRPIGTQRAAAARENVLTHSNERAWCAAPNGHGTRTTRTIIAVSSARWSTTRTIRRSVRCSHNSNAITTLLTSFMSDHEALDVALRWSGMDEYDQDYCEADSITVALCVDMANKIIAKRRRQISTVAEIRDRTTGAVVGIAAPMTTGDRLGYTPYGGGGDITFGEDVARGVHWARFPPPMDPVVYHSERRDRRRAKHDLRRKK